MLIVFIWSEFGKKVMQSYLFEHTQTVVNGNSG